MSPQVSYNLTSWSWYETLLVSSTLTERKFKVVETARPVWKDAAGTPTKKCPKSGSESDNPMVCNFLCSRNLDCKAVHYDQATKLCHLYESLDAVLGISWTQLGYQSNCRTLWPWVLTLDWRSPQQAQPVGFLMLLFYLRVSLPDWFIDRYSPWNAIDGSTVWDYEDRGMFHSNSEDYPWFAIDLVSPQKISHSPIFDK